MAIKSLDKSSLVTPQTTNSMLAGYSFQDYELIESVFVASTTASVTFNNLNQYATEYKHLQIRSTTRVSTAESNAQLSFIRINGDTGSNYSRHFLQGNGGAAASGAETSQSSMYFSFSPQNSSTSGVFSGEVIDFLDAYSTTKNKTIKILHGVLNTGSSGPRIMLNSSVRLNTESITSITCLTGSNSFVAGSRFSLYGIR
jgi:hypothetical protein